MSLPGAIEAAEEIRTRANSSGAAAFGKHLTAHKVANGQDFGQSGTDCFWSRQHGMPSGMAAIFSIPAIGSASMKPAADGVTIGAVVRIMIARIESRRGNKDQNFTAATCHIVQCKKRRLRLFFRLSDWRWLGLAALWRGLKRAGSGLQKRRLWAIEPRFPSLWNSNTLGLDFAMLSCPAVAVAPTLR